MARYDGCFGQKDMMVALLEYMAKGTETFL
jgi:hypothetical protein